MNEEVIYSNKNVQVTASRVIADSITFSVRNINSVGVKKIRTVAIIAYVFLGFSIPFLMTGVINILKSYEDPVYSMLGYFESGLWSLLIFAVCVLVAGVLLLLWDYRIVISNASGVSYILKSKNRESLDIVVEHINEAIARSIH